MTAAHVALVGNPNCGKTTLFNALTRGRQRVGNWPGVTVERSEGRLAFSERPVQVVDLPGIYALLATSDDERVARDYVLSGNCDLAIDVVDATNLERNLFLTTQLLDLGVPLLVVVNMLDLAEAQGIAVDLDALSAELGCTVVGTNATDPQAAHAVAAAVTVAVASPVPGRFAVVPQPEPVEDLAGRWTERLAPVATSLRVNCRWLTLKLAEGDAWTLEHVIASGALDRDEIDGAVQVLEARLGEAADIALAEARYRFIETITAKCVRRPARQTTRADRIDRIVLSRLLGIPIFLAAMYLLFWATVNLGGAFVDFFDILGHTVFVDGTARLLATLGGPSWLTTVLAGGVGAGVQTVLTFVPIVFVMFVGLAVLEDSGYMARAAFVMDRFMRWLGLPGKSFVPMLLGFGCNVPAIMATRTLENKRDRYLTIFINPFMSCSARLPVYALFGAAFFGAAAGAITFSLYLTGIAAAVLSGLLLKRTLFRGEAGRFVMELPPYHRPRLASSLRHGWRRLLIFMTRARYIVPIVALLAVLNAAGTDGRFDHAGTPSSLLSRTARTLTPVFTPMGVEQGNWPATVGIVSGVLAKESVVSSLNSLYAENGTTETATGQPGLIAGARLALSSVPADLRRVPGALADPLGVGVIGGSRGAVAAHIGADAGVYAGLRNGFSGGRPQAYAYLLFVLLYLPCVASFGAMTKEMGLRHSLLATGYIGVVAWSTATLFYQLAAGHSPLWTGVSLALPMLLAVGLHLLGRQGRARPAHRLEPIRELSS